MSVRRTGHLGCGRTCVSAILVLAAAALSVWAQVPKSSVPGPEGGSEAASLRIESF